MMMAVLKNLVLGLVLVSGVAGWDISNERDRQSCQSRSRNPLDGCQVGKTVFVGGGNASIQAGTVYLLLPSTSSQY